MKALKKEFHFQPKLLNFKICHFNSLDKSSHLFAFEMDNADNNICDYLNISTTTKSDVGNLTGKFAILDASKNLTVFEWLFSSMIHQLIVAKCAYQFKVAQVASDWYHNTVLMFFDKLNCISPVLPWIVFPNIFTPISILFNLSLIWVTCTKMTDHKVCNWLIAFDSLCQLFVVAPFGVNLLGVIFQYSTIDYRCCLATLMAATVASYASIMAMYLISLERLLIIMYPIKMNWNKKSTVRWCSIVSVVFCSLFGILMNLNVFNVWTIINIPYMSLVYCNSGLYSDVLNTVPSYVILLLCTLNYAAIFGLILWRHQTNKGSTQTQQSAAKSASDRSMRKMLRSVFLLLLVLLIGWLISSAARNLITVFFRDSITLIINSLFSDTDTQNRLITDITSWVIGIITCLPILASASGAPILLLNSNDYRTAYKKAMGRRNNSPGVGPLFSSKIVMISNVKEGKVK